MNTIFDKINNAAANLTEADLDQWVVPEIMQHYQKRIDSLARKIYAENSNVGSQAFTKMAKIELRAALHTFIFKNQYWKVNRDINPYLSTCLTRLADRTYYDSQAIKKVNAPICPLCKTEGNREYLICDKKLWRCQACTNKTYDLMDAIKITSDETELKKLNASLNLYTAFALHGRKGYRCPDCSNFIPNSIASNGSVSCPYPGCSFLGSLSELEVIAHPVRLTHRTDFSLQGAIHNDKSGKETTFQDLFPANVIQADICMNVNQDIKTKYDILMEVMESQIETIKRMNSPGTLFQKLLMYEAYKVMLEKHPEEMIGYLVHQKQVLDFPIQSKIFQEYAGLVENFLPFSIEKNNQTIDIVDLTDPNLALFLGISKFEAVVRSDYTIPNNTKETYTGGRKFKNYGPCFIGKLISLVHQDTQENLMKEVIEHSFVSISVTNQVPIGTPVLVTHFRIASHYQLDSLVYLQKIRRNIVDSVYLRLNKKKRIPRENKYELQPI